MADITQDFVDANVLTAAQLNGWKDDRTGNLLPIAPAAGASPYNYTGATYDVGSATYPWRGIYAQGDINLYESGTKKIFLSPDASTTSYFNTSSGIYVFGATSASFSSKVEITGNTYITGSLNVGSTGGYENKVTIYDSGTDGTIIYPLKIYSGKTGGGATSSGMGAGIEFQWIQSNGNPYVGARIAGVSHDGSAGRGDLSIFTRYDGSTVNELMRFTWDKSVYSFYYLEAQVTAGSNNIEVIPFSVKTTYAGSGAVGLTTGIGFQVMSLNGNHYQICKITAEQTGLASGNLNFYTMNNTTVIKGGYFDYTGNFYAGYNATISGDLSVTGTTTITDSLTVTNQHRCLLSKSAQSVSQGSTDDINFDTETYDVGGLHSTVTNTNRVTIVTGGVFLLIAHVTSYTSGTDQSWTIRFKKNGSEFFQKVNVTTDVYSYVYTASASDYFTVAATNSNSDPSTQDIGIAFSVTKIA